MIHKKKPKNNMDLSKFFYLLLSFDDDKSIKNEKNKNFTLQIIKSK
jgi:hypothetical protein